MNKFFATLLTFMFLATFSHAQIVITEIFYNQDGTDTLEFIEIYNNGNNSVNLSNYRLELNDDRSDIEYQFSGGASIAAGEYLVIAKDSVFYNTLFGGNANEWDRGSLSNSGEYVLILDAQMNLVDSVDYGVAAPWPTYESNYSIELKDVNSDNNDPANWCLSGVNTGAVAGDDNYEVWATPGTAFDSCRVFPTLSYVYNHIADVTAVDANGVPSSSGTAVELRGVVHCGDFVSGNSIGFYLLEYNNVGINTYANATSGISYTVREGDSLHVFGVIDQYNGTTQIILDSVSLIDSSVATVTPMNLSTALTEAEENKLIQLNNVNLVDSTAWTTGSGRGGFNVDVTDGTTTWTVRIDNDVDLYSQPAPMGKFNIYGFGNQYDNRSPYDEGYQLLACNSSISAAINTEIVNNTATVRIFPNPTHNILNVRAAQMDAVIITNVLGQAVLNLQNINTNNLQINTSDLAKGVYTISILNKGHVYTQQLVKQ